MLTAIFMLNRLRFLEAVIKDTPSDIAHGGRSAGRAPRR